MTHVKVRFVILLLAAVMLLSSLKAVNTGAEQHQNEKIINVAVAENSPRYIDRILYEAFSKLGYKISVTCVDMMSAVVGADSGQFDGLGMYVEGLDEEYANLVRIPESISFVEYGVFAKKGNRFNINSWNDIAGLRVAFESQRDYIAEQIQYKASSAVGSYNISDLFDRLAADESDVVILQKIADQEMIIPDGIEHVASIDKQPVYPFVHKSYEYLITELTNVLRDMNSNGTIEKLQGQERDVLHNQNDKKRFLYISSNSEDATWDEELSTELKSIISENETNEVYTVSLNTTKYPGDYSNSKIVINMIRSHFASSDPDAIIVSDNKALDFIKENYFPVFKGVPVIFCGINNYSPEMIKGYEKYFTGVVETLSVAETTEQMLSMFPKTKNIFVINDYSDDGRAWQRDIELQLEMFYDRVNVTYNPNVEMSQLMDIIRKLPPDSLILSGTYFLDSSNVYFSEKMSEKSFDQNNIPVFSLINSRVGHGEVGGKCVSGSYQGYTAGKIAMEIALGANVSDIPVVVDTENENKWIFDYRVLKDYNLTKFTFPHDVVFLNKPPSLRESNPVGFYLVISATIVILSLICVLLVYQRKLSNKNKSLILSQTDLHTTEELLEKEIQLRESKELMEKVVQAAPLAYIFSVNSKVMNSNIYAQEQLDIFPGDDIESIYDDIDQRYDLLKEVELTNFLSSRIVRYKTKDFGVNRFHVNVSKADYQGKNAHIVWGVNMESSENQKDSLEKAYNDMQKVLNALPIPFLILNPRNMELIYANNSFLSLFRLDKTNNFKEIDVLKLLPEKQPNGECSVQLIRNLLKQSEKSASPIVGEVQHMTNDGELIDIKTVSETLSYRGTNSVIVLMQDISAEKKQAQMLKNTAEKEKEANQLKNRFIVNMSHEIRTPMNAIIGLSEIEITKFHSKETYNTFRKINSSAKNLLTIVNDILDFSKIEAEKIDIMEDTFDLEEVISDAMIIASQRLEDNNVEMLMDIDCNLPSILIGDKVRLWQVLKNLLDNSAKYTTKGNIILTVKALNNNPIDNVFIKFQIADTGLGIKQSNLEKLFTPFEQFHQNEVNVQGTGLGMVITKQLTELMGGKISVASKHGVGTTITVIIPFKLTTPVLSIKNNCSHEELDQKRVLIVDDNPLITGTVSRLLKNVGLIPSSANNAHEAYERVVSSEKNNMPFDVILIDYLLEYETCLELAKKIKDSVSNETKLILLAAHSLRMTSQEIKENGFADVIEKPFVPTSFMQKICIALNIDIKSVVTDKRIKFNNAKVLICEDNKINQEVAQGMLSLCNITPTIAENGQEAIELLQSQNFHMIFMDILMPVMDGHKATICIRNSNKPYANIPIVAMTANAMKDEVDKCKEEGMNGHISKPIDFEKLYVQLKKWLPKECRLEEMDISGQNYDNEIIIDGIDTAQGIARYGGNKERYMRALYKYATTFNGIENPFNELVLDENIENLKKQIHMIKGVSGNLGITPIYKAAIAFEESLLLKEPDELLYRELQNICTSINKTIIDTLSNNNSKYIAAETGTFLEQSELLDNLRNSLQSFDPESSEKVLAQLKSKRRQRIDETKLLKLCNEVESYRFESALEFLDSIQKDLQQQNN